MDPLATTFVLLPSPLLGPATWAPVARSLRGLGHDVVEPARAPTPPDGPEEVRARFMAAVPPDEPVALVVHSNAGLYVPGVVAARPNVAAIVFVDAGVPPRRGRVPLAPPALLDHLRGLADDTGRLPRWTDWFPADDVDALFPDGDTRTRVAADQHALPLACLDASLDVPIGWEDRACGYLAFGDTYATERATATARGWPVLTLDGRHLHMLVAPDVVAASIRELLGAGRSRAE